MPSKLTPGGPAEQFMENSLPLALERVPEAASGGPAVPQVSRKVAEEKGGMAQALHNGKGT